MTGIVHRLATLAPILFAVIVPGLGARESSTSLSNVAIVLPFKVDPKIAAEESPYLGFAIGNLLENVLALIPNSSPMLTISRWPTLGRASSKKCAASQMRSHDC